MLKVALIYKQFLIYVWKIEKLIREKIYSFDSPVRRKLYDRKRRLARIENLSDSEMRELEKINVKLGNFPRRPKLSKTELEKRKAFAESLVSRILTKDVRS